MKLARAQAARFCARPDPDAVGALLHGQDEAQVRQSRDRLLAALLGPEAEAEMRLSRLAAAEVRSDPASVDAALRAQGFFPGPRAVIVAGATDGLSDVLAPALKEARPDAFLLVTADALPAKSSLRKLFEAATAAVAIAFYPDPPDRAELATALEAAGVADADPDALAALEEAAREIGRGPTERLIEVLALHRAGGDGPLGAEDVAALAPVEVDGAVDEAVEAALSGEPAALRRHLARLAARGTSPATVAMTAVRRLRQLHAVAASGPRAAAALARIQPPSARAAAETLARRWGAARLERALSRLMETDAGLRGGSAAPERAALERALMRLAAEAERR